MAGKLDSRQKMINMMYLVFIAMLALNIDKEVLATIGVINEDFGYVYLWKDFKFIDGSLKALQILTKKKFKTIKKIIFGGEGFPKDIIHKIQLNKSVILRAPTSSGKTFLAMSAGILHKRNRFVTNIITYISFSSRNFTISLKYWIKIISPMTRCKSVKFIKTS